MRKKSKRWRNLFMKKIQKLKKKIRGQKDCSRQNSRAGIWNTAWHGTKTYTFFMWLLKHNKPTHKQDTSCLEQRECRFGNLQQQTKNYNRKTLLLGGQGENSEKSFKPQRYKLLCLWKLFTWNSITTAMERRESPLQSIQVCHYKIWQNEIENEAKKTKMTSSLT